jgi:hypothetical protein
MDAEGAVAARLLARVRQLAEMDVPALETYMDEVLRQRPLPAGFDADGHLFRLARAGAVTVCHGKMGLFSRLLQEAGDAR